VLSEEKPEMLKQDFITSLQLLFLVFVSACEVLFPRLLLVLKNNFAGTTPY